MSSIGWTVPAKRNTLTAWGNWPEKTESFVAFLHMEGSGFSRDIRKVAQNRKNMRVECEMGSVDGAKLHDLGTELILAIAQARDIAAMLE